VEFRDGLRWDAGFGAGVQVHRLEGGVSYLQSNWAGGQNSGPGDSYGTPEEYSVLGSHARIHVRAVDPAAGVAKATTVGRLRESRCPAMAPGWLNASRGASESRGRAEVRPGPSRRRWRHAAH